MMQQVPDGLFLQNCWMIWNPGDYVMVHAGIAIAKITDSSENESNQIMEQLDEKSTGNN